MKRFKRYTAEAPDAFFYIPQDAPKSWLTLYYVLPEELACKWRLATKLPRCPYAVLRTNDYDYILEEEAFVSLVWDSYAWVVWDHIKVKDYTGEYRGIPGTWAHYSGDFPLWRLAYHIVEHIRDVYEEIGLGFQVLSNIPRGVDVPYSSMEDFWGMVGYATQVVIDREGWQLIIDEIWAMKTLEDYEFKIKNNSYRQSYLWKWYQNRNREILSLEELREKGTEDYILNGLFFSDIIDEVNAKLKIDMFMNSVLCDKDRKILKMRLEGYTEQDIADKMGYKTHSAIHKRISKISNAYIKYQKE